MTYDLQLTTNKMNAATAKVETHQNEKMQRYYRRHAAIYDLSRWTFLFGRKEVIRRLPFEWDEAISVLEIGCGTGYNLETIAKNFPNARLTGLDVSADMIDRAANRLIPFKDRVTLIQKPYQRGGGEWGDGFDVILFSYSLTMINPQWEDLLQQAKTDLKPGGILAAVDFHDSRFGWFKRHMGRNHVRMDGHLTPVMERAFAAEVSEVKGAYLGVWDYFVFLGRKEE